MTLNEAVTLLLRRVQSTVPAPRFRSTDLVAHWGQALGRLSVDVMTASPGTYPPELAEAVQVLEQAGPQAGMTALLAHAMAASGHGLDLITAYELLGAPRLAPSPDEQRRLSRPPAASPEALLAVYQIKVTLRGSKPPIWRRLLVAGDSTLHDLHRAVQAAFGWGGYHLHQFTINGAYFGVPPEDGESFGYVTLDEKKVQLAQVVPGPQRKFRYEYDFGDSWEHDLLVEKVLPRDPSVHYPVCTAGRRATPPEDSGGIWSYSHKLEALAAGPQDEAEAAGDEEEDDESLYGDGLGSYWNPEAFNLEAINQRLADLRPKKKRRKGPS